MNKNIAIVLSCAVSILGLVSCNNKEADLLKPKDKTHTVVFKAQTPDATETKTALTLKVVPDWRKTNVDDVHIFETETTSSGAVYRTEANLVKMDTPINNDWSIARFSAAFDNAQAIVVPPTKAESTTGFKYTTIMASTLVEEGQPVKYIVPSVQYPDEEAWIDPQADMLIGCDGTTYSHYLDEDQEIGLSFKRPVALARLAITNLEGTTVSKVKMTTANHITGYVTYDDVNFDERKIEAFNGDDSNKELTILYPKGEKKTTTFYAYFVCVPGTIQFSKIEVFTDQYVFTKTYATPASLPFTAGDFKNIALDMTPKNNNGVTRTGLGQQTLKFVDANQQEVTEPIEFDLKDGKENFVAPTLEFGTDVVEANKEKVAFSTSNAEVATVDDAGAVSLVGAKGEATITAAVPGDDTHAAGYASYKIIVTDTTAPATVTFYKANEIEDGEKYVIVSGGKALTAALGAQDVTIENDTFEAEPDEYTLWTATAHVEYYEGTDAAGHFTLKNGEKYLQRKSNQSDQTVIVDGVPSKGKYYVWNYDGEYLSHLSSSTTTFYLGYNSGWVVVYQGTLPKTTLYSTSKPRTKQEISFGEDPVTAKYDLNGGTWTVAVPTLSGAKTAVTYESSNTTAVEVNASTGAVTITTAAKKGDKATITATAEKTDEYTSATASYTIEIIDSTPVAGVTIKLEPATELVAGNKYILVSNEKVLVRDGESAAAYDFDATNVSVTVPGELAENVEWALEKTTGTITRGNEYVFTQGTYFFGIAMNTNQQTYTYTVEVSDGRDVATNVSIQDHNINLTNNLIYYAGNSSNYYVFYNTTDNKWDNEKVSNSATPAATSKTALYQVKDERAEQILAFTSNTAVFDKGTSVWTEAVPTLNGAQTNVTFESSNTEIATVTKVNNTTVTVTVTSGAKAGDTVVITAKAEGDATYKPAQATFTVSVTNSNLPTYVKADSMDANEEYLIVSNGFVLKNNNGTVAASAVTENDGVIKYDPEASEIWTASSDGELINNEKYLRLNNNALAIGSKSGTASNNQWTYDSSTPYLKVSSYYLYYSSSSSKFSVSNLSLTDYPSHIAALYVLDNGQPKKRNLAFSAESMSVNIYGKTTPYVLTGTPTISGKGLTDVTYSVSANTNIASVDPDTGAVTLGGETGTVTITASADATDDYQAGEASYTLTVTNTAPPTYTKVDEITSGATYLIVSTDYNNYNSLGEKRAFAGDTSGSVVEVDGTSGTITGDFSACEFVITKEGDNYSLYGPNGYVTGQSNSDPYIQVSSSKVTMSLTDATTLKAASSGDGLVSDAFYFYYTKTSNTGTSTEVLYLNKNGKFKIGGSGRKYGVYLYKKN